MKDKLIAITTLGFIFSLFFYYKVVSPVDSTLTSKKIDESDPVVNFVNQIEEQEKMEAIINPIIDSLNSEDNVSCKLNIDETNELSFSEAFKYYRECGGNNSSFNWNENVYSTLLKSEFEAKHPQLEPKRHAVDAEALKDASPQVKLYGSDQLFNGSINTLQKKLGITAADKRIRGSFTLATGNTLATALTSSASLGSVSISVS